MKALLIALALCLPAVAAEPPAAEAINAIAGVYKQRFTNGMVTPGKAPIKADVAYQSEDIIEIVPVDDARIYFRAKLQFYNGHACSIFGLAAYQNGQFVFHDPEKNSDGVAACTLTLTPSAEALTLTDRLSAQSGATCRASCGARGSLSAVSMPMKNRRPIRYLQRILASPQYKQAHDDYKQYVDGLTENPASTGR